MDARAARRLQTHVLPKETSKGAAVCTHKVVVRLAQLDVLALNRLRLEQRQQPRRQRSVLPRAHSHECCRSAAAPTTVRSMPRTPDSCVSGLEVRRPPLLVHWRLKGLHRREAALRRHNVAVEF